MEKREGNSTSNIHHFFIKYRTVNDLPNYWVSIFFDNNLMSIIFWWLGHIFLLLAMTRIIILPIKIRFPSSEKLMVKIGNYYLILGGLVLLINLSNVEIFRTVDNIINWYVPGISIAVIFIAAAGSIFILTGIYVPVIFKKLLIK